MKDEFDEAANHLATLAARLMLAELTGDAAALMLTSMTSTTAWTAGAGSLPAWPGRPRRMPGCTSATSRRSLKPSA